MNYIKTNYSFDLEAAITEASNCVSSYYPLTNFIACNALKGWEDIPFTEAMRRSNEYFGGKGFLPLAEYRSMYESGRIAPCDLEEAFRNSNADNKPTSETPVFTLCEMFDRVFGENLLAALNTQMMKWCSAYLDTTQAQWKPKSKQASLYGFWKEMASYDLSMFWFGVRGWSTTLETLPACSRDAIGAHLREMGVEDEQVAAYLRRHITQMPGFASYIKWRQLENREDGLLTDYLAIRLHYEKILSQTTSNRRYGCKDLALIRPLLREETKAATTSYPQTPLDYAHIWQDAYELNYRNRLISSLHLVPPSQNDKSCCQLVFCIDVRSEPIRRKLEQLGPYSTYGFAGFFGMPIRYKELGSQTYVDLCPVLLKPDKQVEETTDIAASSRKTSWQALKVSALLLKKKLKCDLASAFGLVEFLGLCSCIPLLGKTFAPYQTAKALRVLESGMAGQGATCLDLSSFSLNEKVAFAEGALKGIGLTNFGKLIVICGHKSSSANNPYASALDCGACGGNGGSVSARLAAQILNDKKVRVVLAAKGMDIPSDSIFVAAEHDTTTDLFQFFDIIDLPEDHGVIFQKLQDDLAQAGDELRKRREATLPESCLSPLNSPLERAYDWAQIAPEWGLAGNAAFIAAPRSMSKDTDLEGRVFLHSYDHTTDPEYKVLELIMTAPLVVAQWINMQYYLSTVDNTGFGSGSKVIHNVVGDFGVMQGGQSDLQLGLPLQSLMTANERIHEPMRLIAVLRAPLQAIDQILLKHPEVGRLVSNKWIRLVASDPDTQTFYEADDIGRWRKVREPANTSEQDKLVPTLSRSEVNP